MAARRVEREYPLFPLGIVAIPHERIPLHIFEERYKTMIELCLEHEREFGIVWLSEQGLKDVGCSCAIDNVLERMDDGRLDILVRGTGVFRLRERSQDLAYPAGTIELLADRVEQPDEQAADAARDAYATLVERATDRRPTAEELSELSAYAMAATVELSDASKQRLLELRSENARMKLTARLFTGALERVAEARRAQEQARSNGKVTFG